MARTATFPITQTGRRRALAALLATLALATAACGSQLSPETVASVNGAPAPGGGVSTPGGGGVLDGSGPNGTLPGGPGSGSGDGAGTGTSAGNAPGAGGPTGDAPQGHGQNSSDGGTKAASCNGFKNQTGITDDKIVIANASDISGPVPGIFESAQQATRAYAAYFNSTSDICGRKLEVMALDSRADAGADQQAYAAACDKAFAGVGSMSAFDSGGAATAEGCGLPDLRSGMTTPERRACSTCFATQSLATNLVPTALPKYWVGKDKEATQHVAVLYVNVHAAEVNAKSFVEGWGRNGWNIDLVQGIDVSEFNYSPYVQQMKDDGIDFVVYLGPYQFTIRLQQAMQQQSFEPSVFLQDATIYDQRYVDQAGDAGDGSYVFSTTQLYDNVKIDEVALYRSWLNQISPGAIPDYAGLYAWSATRLFVEQATALGGQLTRSSLVAALGRVKDWTGNGIHAPQQIGAKTTASCTKVLQLKSGKWSQVSPGDFMCGSLVDTGIGG
ncbi:ABC transporter substrate-binding protein [Nocardioides sp.]|uniref:ABC transporter substrate-binding protein n=1 Tax=Nocardioides sp. TaxID=35761 RepID=UPI0031FF34ED|nr:hypothetical protein [Nocardioides sp.]